MPSPARWLMAIVAKVAFAFPAIYNRFLSQKLVFYYGHGPEL
jgi:hypothetical protein